jgi:hypothetical protein
VNGKKKSNANRFMHVNGKVRPAETIPGMRRGGIKKNDGGG